jgi:hypothetical protein
VAGTVEKVGPVVSEFAAALPVAAATAYDAMNRFDLPEGSTLLKARGLQASRTGYVRQHPMGSTPSSTWWEEMPCGPSRHCSAIGPN